MIDLRTFSGFNGRIDYCQSSKPDNTIGVPAELYAGSTSLPWGLFGSEQYHSHVDSLWNSGFRDRFENRDCYHREFHMVATPPSGLIYNGRTLSFGSNVSEVPFLPFGTAIPDVGRFVMSPSGLSGLLPCPAQYSSTIPAWVIRPGSSAFSCQSWNSGHYFQFHYCKSISINGGAGYASFSISGFWNGEVKFDPTKPGVQSSVSPNTFRMRLTVPFEDSRRVLREWTFVPSSRGFTTGRYDWTWIEINNIWGVFAHIISLNELLSLCESFSSFIPNLIHDAILRQEASGYHLTSRGIQNPQLSVVSSTDSRSTLFPVLNRMMWLFESQRPIMDVSTAEWGDLGNESVDNCASFSSNLIAYASDLPKIGDTIRSLLSVITDPTDPKKWASAWLSLRFGDRLSIADSKELISAIRSELQKLAVVNPSESVSISGSRRRFSRPLNSLTWEESFTDAVYRFYWRPNVSDTLSKSVKKLLDWDAWPTLENTWDMIPLSFVVDWFINVSDVLSSIDRENYMLYLNVLSTIQTQKQFLRYSLPLLSSMTKEVSILYAAVSYYERRIVPKLAWRPFHWEAGLPSVVNAIDGYSLLFQAF